MSHIQTCSCHAFALLSNDLGHRDVNFRPPRVNWRRWLEFDLRGISHLHFPDELVFHDASPSSDSCSQKFYYACVEQIGAVSRSRMTLEKHERGSIRYVPSAEYEASDDIRTGMIDLSKILR